MDLSHAMKTKWSPWNWFKNEEQHGDANVPVRRASQAPHTPLNRLHADIDRLFDDMLGGFAFPQGMLSDFAATDGLLRPQLDIREGKDRYTITVEIPGVERDDVDVTVQDGTLTIRGEKRQENSTDDDGVHRVERSYGRFQRVLSLPQDADDGQIDAKFKDGVLTLTIPRNQDLPSSARRIAISS